MTQSRLLVSPAEVMHSHQGSMDTRLVNSVVPEVTDINLDSAFLLDVATRLGIGNFHREGIVTQGPRNLLAGIRLNFINDQAQVARLRDRMNQNQTTAVEELAEALLPIDSHFRQWGQIDSAVQITPMLNILAGKFSGKAASDTNRHFDYGGKLPIVQYKTYFEGDPAFSSLYYPGLYRLPGRFTRLSRVIGGLSEPDYPSPQFKRREGVTHLMPARVTVMEPWNAYHGGPTDKAARGTRRGILTIAYVLSRLPSFKAQQE